METATAPPSQTGGIWFVNLESHKSQAVANERLASLRTKIRGINLSIASANVNGQTYYRVRAAGYASKADATTASSWMATTLKAGPFWIGKDSKKVSQIPAKTTAPVKKQVAKQAQPTAPKPTARQALAKQPIRSISTHARQLVCFR